jgi:hypothetical protein
MDTTLREIKKKRYLMRCNVLATSGKKMAVDCLFRGAYCLHLQGDESVSFYETRTARKSQKTVFVRK